MPDTRKVRPSQELRLPAFRNPGSHCSADTIHPDCRQANRAFSLTAYGSAGTCKLGTLRGQVCRDRHLAGPRDAEHITSANHVDSGRAQLRYGRGMNRKQFIASLFGVVPPPCNIRTANPAATRFKVAPGILGRSPRLELTAAGALEVEWGELKLNLPGPYDEFGRLRTT